MTETKKESPSLSWFVFIYCNLFVAQTNVFDTHNNNHNIMYCIVLNRIISSIAITHDMQWHAIHWLEWVSGVNEWSYSVFWTFVVGTCFRTYSLYWVFSVSCTICSNICGQFKYPVYFWRFFWKVFWEALLISC